MHLASVLLLLTHPGLAADAEATIAQLDEPLRDRAMRRYAAAAALQRMAKTRIQERLGAAPLIPERYRDILAVPSLDEAFGRETLLVVAEEEERRYGYNAWGSYLALLDLFLQEIRRKSWGKPCGSVRAAPA
ncbi:MAG: hypothetical protein U0821_22190 [Chloroflexota bacterium]